MSVLVHFLMNEYSTDPPSTPDNKLYRWFSLRKSVNYDVERRSSTIANTERTSSYTTTSNGTSTISNHRMPQLPEEGDTEHGGLFSENGGVFAHTFQRRHQPPALPPMPQGLSPEQIKRRHIVASIVHSENNYVATLQRLVNVIILRLFVNSLQYNVIDNDYETHAVFIM